jgi:uncharacterized protein affecting Mg2+/Co2+ transport
MNMLLEFSGWAMLAAVIASGAVAAPLDLEVSCERRKFEGEKQQTATKNKSVEKWGYKVVLANKMFKAVDRLDVIYRVYKAEDSQNGVADKLVATAGSVAIPTLKAGEKFTFNTAAVVLNKTTLKGGLVYTDGSKTKLEDGVAGLWLRVRKDDAIVFEYMKPPTLKDKTKWE